jgi:hypothetical protein
MSAVAVEPSPLPPALPGPYADPPSPDALAPHPATVALVRDVVRDLLVSTPNYRALDAGDRVALARNLVRVGSYLAECVRDDWYQSKRLEQRPLVRTRPIAEAQAAAGDFSPAAASQIGRVTTETLRAVAFPVFVSDLIRGTFNAISDASQKQMESYMELLANVSKTVDEYEADDNNASDDQARAWLAQRYPRQIEVRNGTARPAANQPEGARPDFTADLNLSQSVDASDEGQIEGILVPAARRKLAQSRLTLLSTLVLMGINRIVVTGGKIRATMGFHINTRDTAHEESASQLDTRTGVSGSFAYGPFGASASVSIAYVSSKRADSNAEISTQTDLTGEVELHFQSDYFPIERFASGEGIDKIRANTPVPAANIPWGDTSPQPTVERLGPQRQPSSTPFVTLPPSPATPPTAPTPPDQKEAEKKQAAEAKKPAPPAAKPPVQPDAKKPPQPETKPAPQPEPKPPPPAGTTQQPEPKPAPAAANPPPKPPPPAGTTT